jgi:hypothetical protein
MPLSWNEIKTRAAAFSKEWEGTQREEADAKLFLDAFCGHVSNNFFLLKILSQLLLIFVLNESIRV